MDILGRTVLAMNSVSELSAATDDFLNMISCSLLWESVVLLLQSIFFFPEYSEN